MNKIKNYNIQLLFAIILAIIFGIFTPNLMNNLSFLGTIYINLLKFIMIPLIFTNITIAASKFDQGKNVTGGGYLIFRTILLFVVMFMLSFLITSGFTYIVSKNLSFKFPSIKWDGSTTELNISTILTNIFPDNILSIFQNSSLLALVIFSFLLGMLAKTEENGQEVLKVINGLKNIFDKLLEYIMCLTPLGTFALVGTVIAKYQITILKSGLIYISLAYISGLLVLIFVMILPVCLISKISPMNYIKKIKKVWFMTFTTCSSAATLPLTLKTCKEDLQIPSEVSDFVVPLGTTINMCGGAVSFALLSIFTSKMYGIDLTLQKYLLMLISATLINMSAPGIPNGGIVIGATYLSILGIPLSFIGFYSSIYKLLDMVYTTLNVTGDISANMIIYKYSKKIRKKAS